MRKIAVLCCAFCALIFTVQANAQLCPKRTSGTSTMSFALPKSIVVSQGVRYEPKCPDSDVVADVYFPKKFANAPCLLLIHGGGWRAGDEKKYALMASWFAERGYVCACISYRLVPEYTLKDAVFDAKSALYWLRTNAKAYGGNPDKIGVIGGSAGGHLASILAVSAGSELSKGIFDDGVSDRVQACVPMGTPFVFDAPFVKKYFASDDLAAHETLSPIVYVAKDNPPTLALHSKNEKVVPFELALKMQKKSLAVGAPFALKSYDSDKHAFWNFIPLRRSDCLESWNDALQFFDKVLKGDASKK